MSKLKFILLLWATVLSRALAGALQHEARDGNRIAAPVRKRALPTMSGIPPEAYVTAMPGGSPAADYAQQKYLDPGSHHELWYWAVDGDGRPNGIRVNMTYNYPAVALDHSTWITNVTCSGSTTIVGHFTKKSAYNYAQTQWTAVAKKKPVFVTSASSCSSDGQNVWYQVSSLSFNPDTQSFTATSQLVQMDDVCDNMKIGFGPNMNMNGHGFDDGLRSAQSKPTTVTKTSKPPQSTYGPATVTPPASTISGLPAVAAGPDFDKNLDDHLGYYYDNNTDPGAVLSLASGGTISASHLNKRLLSAIGNFISNVASTAVSTLYSAGKAIIDGVTAVANLAIGAISILANVTIGLIKFIATGQAKASSEFDINLAPPYVPGSPFKDDTGDFSNFYPLYTDTDPFAATDNTTSIVKQFDNFLTTGNVNGAGKFAIYCVDCGVFGKIGVSGSITASLTNGVTEARLGVGGKLLACPSSVGHLYTNNVAIHGENGSTNANDVVLAKFVASLYLAISALAMKNVTKEYDIYSPSLTAWTIQNIAKFGPELAVQFVANMQMTALGELFVGTGVRWPDAQAVLDLVDESKTGQSGWSPSFNPFAKAAGELTAAASLGLPVGLNFVLEILNKKFAEAGLFDTPALEAEMSASFSYGTSSTDSTGLSCNIGGNNGCKGIGYQVGITNSLDFKGDGFDDINLFKLGDSGNIASGCVTIPLPKGCASRHRSRRELPSPFTPAGLIEDLAVVAKREPLPPRLHHSALARRDLRKAAHQRRQSGDNDTAGLPVAAASIQDSTRQYQLYPHWNGNIFAGPANATNMTMLTGNNQFMSITSNNTDIVWGDKNERLLHYFPATMNKLGVSRLRLAGWMDLPKGSLALTLAPGKDPKSGVTMLVAIDVKGAHFWMYTCMVAGQGNKVFLVNDNDAGPKTLMQKTSQFLVTGGLATNCIPIAVHNAA